MQISEIIAPELCKLGEQASSRKKALQVAAKHLESYEPQLDAFTTLKALVTREQLGSTAIGNGVALPHGRLIECDKPIAILLTLDAGVDFDAPDAELVNLIFCLIVPQQYNFQQLGGLNRIVEVFSNKVLRAQMRNAHNDEALFDIMHVALTQYDQEQANLQAPIQDKNKDQPNETSHS
ncbi:PTS sugar transporter subunit IIA [Kangiella sp. TOML190]|uniref:PTS sugar transporter subunit IIA n=1 Tax=Kangiella sp. TOML190 TaxID=2931351 RepID=UPI00203BAA08|nr:PTS sugar transporter subunit IIA [Kangiella sp. TOML190]